MWKSEGDPAGRPTRLWSKVLAPDGLSFAASTSPTMLLETADAWEGHVIENPSMVRYDGAYWLLYSGNDWASPDYGMGVARCNTPIGPCYRTLGSPLVP